jgi:hypothetical protein
MSDAHHYFMAHAIRATLKARKMPRGRIKKKQRVVARVYHLLAKEAAFAPNLHHMDDSEKPAKSRTPLGSSPDLPKPRNKRFPKSFP